MNRLSDFMAVAHDNHPDEPESPDTPPASWPPGGDPGPELLPFDPGADDDFDHEDFDPEPDPSTIPAAAVIRCPVGPQPTRRGYDVFAIRSLGTDDDGDEIIEDLQQLSGRFSNDTAAKLHAMNVAFDHEGIEIPATHIVVNNEIGEESHRIPLLGRVA